MKIYLYALVASAATLALDIMGVHGAFRGVPLYDVFMHLLAGAAISLTILAVLWSLRVDTAHIARNILIGVFLAGIAWELFEITYNIAGYQLWTLPYYVDTLKDLLDDILGGVIVIALMLQ